MNVLVFDIETVPDVELGRRLYDVADLDDATVAKIMFFKQKQARQTDFLPLPQHRVVAISAVLRNRDGLKIFSIGEGTRFFSAGCVASFIASPYIASFASSPAVSSAMRSI